ncbi:MAG: hypothetical protein DCF25_21445 [Leptolyngbya foveolarum]|uniref:SLH domain-containing protein n=1 Tax=Leptolyngbya foveolarum TaxID=47253 RepID=A0A2W4TQ08_9CYAN|nr:MAG: hypothetical protein DCF25_21445 [Leptolyngbya foveolarum]
MSRNATVLSTCVFKKGKVRASSFRLLLSVGSLWSLLGSVAAASELALFEPSSESKIDLEQPATPSPVYPPTQTLETPAFEPSEELAQVTSVSELSDVQPGDWAFTALQRLVEEYGCLEGYPDNTFQGNSALTRYEFAAGLNACLDVVVQLVSRDDNFDEIRRLQEEFATELATVRADVDTLETDVAMLEANQFSTREHVIL